MYNESPSPPPEPEVDLGPRARLVVQTTAICQTRDADISRCDTMEGLRSLFFEEFPSVLKGLRPKHMQLFCLAPAPGRGHLPYITDDDRMWLLVTRDSDFRQVMECPAFRLQDERCDEAIENEYVIAFAEDRGRGRRGRSRRKYEPRQQPLALGYNPALDEQRLAESHYSASEVGSVRPYGRGGGGRDRERDRDDRSDYGGSTVSRSRGRPPRDRSPSGMSVRSYRSASSRRRGYASAPASVVGMPLGGDGDGGSGGSSGEDSATSSRRLLRGRTGSTRQERERRERDSYSKGGRYSPPDTAALTSDNLEHLTKRLEREVSSSRGGSRRPSRAGSRAQSVVSHWDDDDPDGTGRSARSQVRGGGLSRDLE